MRELSCRRTVGRGRISQWIADFSGGASNPKTTPELLRATMTAQHGRMPDLSISKHQQDDLVAYIFTLRQK